MRTPLQRLALTALALGAPLATSHCQRDAAAPSAAAAAANECCEITANAALAPGLGRIVVSYPGDGASSTRLDVFAAGDASRAIESKYGNATLEFSPGTYDVTVGGRRVAGVSVRAGHDTRIRAGALHVHASEGTRIDLLDHESGATLAGGYGEKHYGLPVGSVGVQVAGQEDTVQIEDGQVADF